jgi:DnaJ-like protein
VVEGTAVNLLEKIAEARIREAMVRGEFDDLEGKGRRLELEDLSGVPPDLRASYVMLKNAGVLPEEMQLRKEMVTLEALLDACEDPAERTRLRKDLNWKLIRFRILMERRRPRAIPASYRAKMIAKFTR